MSEWRNPCGGVRWRTLPDGTVEIEGRGVVTREPGSAAFEAIRQNWENWEPEFRAAGREFGIPAAWLSALAYTETGFVAHDPELQARIESRDGFHSIGIMQPIPATALAYGFSLESRYDPLQNIRLGAKIARANVDKYGATADFPTIAVSHNAGSRSCQQCPVKKCNPGQNQWNVHQYSDYLATAIPALNTAILSLGAGERRTNVAMIAGISVAAVGLGVAALVLTGAMPKLQHKMGL